MVLVRGFPSPVGRLTAASDGESINGLWIEGQKYFEASLGSKWERGDAPVFDRLERWLERYFSGKKPGAYELPVAPVGSEFRRAVWKCLMDIPYGETVTYGEIAARVGGSLGRGTSARAVGGAVGHNPISIIIPCHRVIGADGSLTGYAGGLDVKKWLLKHEGVNIENK